VANVEGIDGIPNDFRPILEKLTAVGNPRSGLGKEGQEVGFLSYNYHITAYYQYNSGHYIILLIT